MLPTQLFQNFQISAENIISNYVLLLRLVNTFFCYYPRVLPKVNDAKTFKNPVVLFYTLRSQIICMLAHLTGAFKISRFSDAYYGVWLEGYEIICDRSILFAVSQEDLKFKPVNINSRSLRTLMRKTSTDLELSNYPKRLTFIFIAIKTKKSL